MTKVNFVEGSIEIICVDDGSTDGSSAILAEYAARDGRIRVIRQENSGTFAARKRAVAETTGDYLCFVDPDDRIEPTFCETLLVTAEKGNWESCNAVSSFWRCASGQGSSAASRSGISTRMPQITTANCSRRPTLTGGSAGISSFASSAATLRGVRLRRCRTGCRSTRRMRLPFTMSPMSRGRSTAYPSAFTCIGMGTAFRRERRIRSMTTRERSASSTCSRQCRSRRSRLIAPWPTACSTTRSSRRSREFARTNAARRGDDVRFTSFGNCVWNKLFRADYLKRHGIRFQKIARSNDLAFCIEALARTDRIAVVPRTLYRYRINGGGLQSTKSASPDCWREALAEVRRRLERADLLPRFAVALKRLERQVAGDNLPGGRFSPRKILHSIRRRGLLNFLKHAYGRLLR